MAQTGVTSAVGLAIEQAWRTPPLTVISGSNYKIGVASQHPHRFWKVDPGAGMPAKVAVNVPDNEIDGDIQLTRTIKEAITYDGSIAFKADGENLHYPLLAILGKCVQTQIQTAAGNNPAANVFSNIFTPGIYFPSFTGEEIFGDASQARASSGIVSQMLDLTFGRTMMASMGVIPYRQVPNVYLNSTNVFTKYYFDNTNREIPAQMGGNGTKKWIRTAAPGYIDVEQEQPLNLGGNGPFVFGNMAFGLQGALLGGIWAPLATNYMMVDYAGVSMDLLEGFTLNITRKIDAQMVAGSGFDPGACTGSQISVSGRFNILYKDTTIQLAALNHSPIALNFQLIGCIPGANGTKAYVIDVFLPNCRFTMSDGPTLVDGPMLVGGNYVARRDPVLGYAIKITLQNTFDMSQVGQMYPLAATLKTGNPVTGGASAIATLTSAKNIVPGDQHVFLDSVGPTTETLTVSSVNYTTGAVTYTATITNSYAVATTTITKVGTGGGGGWSNA